jgi:hypothetical protein
MSDYEPKINKKLIQVLVILFFLWFFMVRNGGIF